MSETAECLSGWDDRSRLLLGDEGTRRLRDARVLVAGVGGVGGYAVEMLARSGVGHISIVDADCVALSNLNRQLIALIGDLGRPKVDLFCERVRNICPETEITAVREFITPENVGELLDSERYDYVIDAIDTVAPKTALIAGCLSRKLPLISSMGAGGRIDPTKVGYQDIWDTKEDGLARAIRQRLKKMGLRRPLKVVASSEAPRPGSVVELNERNKRSSYGTLAPVPATFGILLANHVILRLSGLK